MTKRETSELPAVVEKRLSSYVIAATAAGVSVLALTPLADGRIVYTKTNKIIDSENPARIDLAHNGINEFSIWRRSSARSTSSVGANSLKTKDRVWGQPKSGEILASALPRGFRIASSKKHFSRGGNYGKLMWRYEAGCRTTNGTTVCTPVYIGQWKQPVNAYLGFQFQLNGKTHYGWARVSWATGNLPVLLGYAYETVPKKPIIAGKTKGPDVITLQDASLGHLARGASAIPAWRHKEQ